MSDTLQNMLIDRLLDAYGLDSLILAKAKYDELIKTKNGRNQLITLLSFDKNGDSNLLVKIICGAPTACMNSNKFTLLPTKLLQKIGDVFTSFMSLTSFWDTLKINADMLDDDKWWEWLIKTKDVRPFISSDLGSNINETIVTNFIHNIQANYLKSTQLLPSSLVVMELRKTLTKQTPDPSDFLSFVTQMESLDKNFLLKCGYPSNTRPSFLNQTKQHYTDLVLKSTFGFNSLRRTIFDVIQTWEYGQLIKRIFKDSDGNIDEYELLKSVDNGEDVQYKEFSLRTMLAKIRQENGYPPYTTLKNILITLKDDDIQGWKKWYSFLTSDYIKNERDKLTTDNSRAEQDKAALKKYVCSACASSSLLDRLSKKGTNDAVYTQHLYTSLLTLKVLLAILVILLFIWTYTDLGLHVFKQRIITISITFLIILIMITYIVSQLTTVTVSVT